jgi:hypothetical protein
MEKSHCAKNQLVLASFCSIKGKLTMAERNHGVLGKLSMGELRRTG